MHAPVPPSSLFAPLTLPNQAVVPNRIAKAAMEENMADSSQLPGENLRRLYANWAGGGAGLILSGNVMIDPAALTGPGGVVLDVRQPIEPFKAWAQAGMRDGGQMWLQINHPGRQVFAAMGQEAVAPSAIGVDLGAYSHLFQVPRALDEADIAGIVARFATTARLAEAAGFSGVQIHAAHGYLISQFLSPLTNRRTDAWGGELHNRARLLLDVVRAVRAVVSPGFSVAVKLNSADFQKGGFEASDAVQVVRWLNELPVDLVELSGGSYESPAMQGAPQTGGTAAREAYFLDFARDVSAVARMPVMVTGGIRRRAIAEQALRPSEGRPGVAMVGIASAFAFEPKLAEKWKGDEALDVQIPSVGWRNKAYASLAKMALVKLQLRRLGRGRQPKPNASPLLSLIRQQIITKRRTRLYRTWASQARVEPSGA
ncbi:MULTISPECIES: NADH:flavin oxidoreductase/NADH oxidase family protein [Bradyrhizobium]|jgi:2,4-dienoyl-CoA reductase-like NADH-dependent reductase (Old Yellow Enzyme family)|uniref:2,4-dienoyl-CoA reductase n=2 Tax=Bradyrhizobium TaxID=374 RepID=A0ABY0Q397_9BRAD|nr:MULTISPECIES: NADH:flavin oxidoreductase/NADH oxidase family protein [Bradyrhizobium]SDJ42510.1 2,4-dienoyl-CoA reductase [Bradyrhizobium ottawaense]SEC58494.1 2,4-dienoyl-CoA reductase [Bradyrhizobium lablabi]SHK75835.1 2,4-dienoyl-CoA reductase [Bradyrhizobium lablabi]